MANILCLTRVLGWKVIPITHSSGTGYPDRLETEQRCLSRLTSQNGNLYAPFINRGANGQTPKRTVRSPIFYPLGDKHMLLFCSHWQGTQYYLGRFENERYYVENYGRMSWAGGLLGGPRSLLDAQGRRIFFDWIREIRGVEQERTAGWSGVMTVPTDSISRNRWEFADRARTRVGMPADQSKST